MNYLVSLLVGGAEVTLVSGPVNLPPSFTSKKIISVESAIDMEKAIATHSENSDIIIMTAAVSDFRIKNYSTQKIKKRQHSYSCVRKKILIS